MHIPKYLSLFSGIGGFELGIGVRAKCIGFSEIDRYATQIYQSHFDHPSFGDITKIDASQLPDFDLLVGGFPCQSFSIAGRREGFADSRGTMFFEIARIIGEKRPRLLLLENVKGLLSHDQGNTFRTILSTLDELGYELQLQVLNSKNHGVPQNRERVFIVGHLRETVRRKVFPLGIHEQSFVANQRVCTSTLVPRCGGGRGTYVVEGSPSALKVRNLTPLEYERLQSFPDNWTKYGIEGAIVCKISDWQRYKTLGNAVTVNVVRQITERLLR